ncbi:MAG: cyclic nucleotide-binding domain-containing protein, partial [Bacteroidota bacterium]|nr:cyclic nucleotide-binding domain-containing protein [Bacteroidota bacterium]
MSNSENTFGCYDSLIREELQFIKDNTTEISYLKGETIFKQGAFAPHVLLINSGLARVYLQTGINKQISFSLAKQGDYIAFSSIFG